MIKLLTLLTIASILSSVECGESIKIYSVSKAKVHQSESFDPKVNVYTAEAAPAPAPPPPTKSVDNSVIYKELEVAEPLPLPVEPTSPIPNALPIKAPVTYVTSNGINDIIDSYNNFPQYNFAYQVHDGISGNNHGHSEIRNGDAVEGRYSVLHPDGILRTVHYTSDSVNGYNAVLNGQPQVNFIPQASPVQAPFPQYLYAQPTAGLYASTPYTGVAATSKMTFTFSSPKSAYAYSS